MDRKLLLQHLREVDSSIAEAEEYIAQQRKLVKNGDGDFDERESARILLASWEEMYKAHLVSRERVLEEIAKLDGRVS